MIPKHRLTTRPQKVKYIKEYLEKQKTMVGVTTYDLLVAMKQDGVYARTTGITDAGPSIRQMVDEAMAELAKERRAAI